MTNLTCRSEILFSRSSKRIIGDKVFRSAPDSTTLYETVRNEIKIIATIFSLQFSVMKSSKIDKLVKNGFAKKCRFSASRASGYTRIQTADWTKGDEVNVCAC